MKGAITLAAVLLCLLWAAGQAQLLQDDPPALRGIDVTEHLGDTIPLDLEFISGDGDSVQLADYFEAGRPVILILGYYTCPMLCNLVANGVSEAVKQLAWTPGKEFGIVTVSIDSRDTEVIAKAKRDNYIKTLNKPGVSGRDWDFLTGGGDHARTLADAIGFQYYYDEEQDQYAHPALITVLDSEGKICRYLYGVQFRERDLRLALIEAADGKIGNTVDRIILSCFHYDPDARGYVVFAAGVMRLGGAATLIVMSILLTVLWWRERHRRRAAAAGPKAPGGSG
jgi:protein SCO1/2